MKKEIDWDYITHPLISITINKFNHNMSEIFYLKNRKREIKDFFKENTQIFI